MEKTRNERISAVKNQKNFVQSENANGLIKKGTAVFSTTLLVSLLAFPTFSASASANELAETSSKKLEETIEKNDTATEEGQKAAIESDESDYIPEDATEKQQLINELKSVLSTEHFETLTFNELSIEEIDELLTIAIEEAELNKETETSTAIQPIDESSDSVIDETENLDNDTLETDISEELDESEVEVPEKETVKEQAEEPVAVVVEVLETEVVEETTEIETDVPTEELVENNDEVISEPLESEIIEEPATSEDKVTEPVTEPVKEEVIVEKAKVVTPKVATTSVKMAATTSAKKVATTAVEKAKTYTVKSGDTLNKISKANGVTVAQLKKWNKLSSDLIKIGQVLALNETASKNTPTATPTNTNNAIADASTPAGFVNAITSYAKQVAANNNLYASVMIAQAALESGYGTSKLSTSPNYNLFGIKGSYNGNTVTMYTSEWSSSTGWIYIPQNFKKYPSYAESLQDNANLLKRGTSWDNGYYSGAWASNSNSAYEATAWLQGRYATDPSYASKLNAIIKAYNLTQYDTKSSGETAPTTPSIPVSNDNNNVSTPDAGNTSSTSYKVKSGDTLTAIASKYGVSVSNLKSWNNLKSDMIYVNQTLSIKGGSTSGGTTTPTPSPSPSPSTGNTSSTSYKVKSGDTLTGIGSQYGVSVSNLKSWNSLKSDTIYVNQTLTIKGGTTSGGTTSGGTTTPAPNTGNTSSTSYKVISGDTLTAIASKYGVSVANLKSWNNLKTDAIYVNQALTIKGGNTTTAPTPSTGNTSTTSYKVKSGDTLTGIGSKYGVSVSNLKSWNNLTSDTIYVNQALTIKGGTTSGGTTTPNTGNTSSTSYKVKSGDTLTAIASRYGVSVANLKSWNSLKTDTIYVNQALTIKGGNTTTAPAPSTGNTSNTSYTVKSGDTLTGISSKYGVSVSNLKSWNNLKTDAIYVNQALTIKGGTTTPTTAPNTGNTSNTSYIVKSGDTLTGISSKYGVTVSNLKSWNNLKTDAIYVNQALTIKGGNTTTAPAPSTGNTSNTSYTVKLGDTLTGISSKYGVSVSNLKSWNNLKTDAIYVNQALTIKGGTTTPTPVPSTGNTSNTSYTVKSGDTLTGISSKYGVTVANLKSWNNLSTDAISIGQTLVVKNGTASSTAAITKPTTSKTHKVVSGDTLWDIAQKYGMSILELKTANYLKSDVIFVDQFLIIK